MKKGHQISVLFEIPFLRNLHRHVLIDSPMARKASTPIYLNVYDLAPTNEYLYPWGLGTYHSGVQIGSDEYSFASGTCPNLISLLNESYPNLNRRRNLRLISQASSKCDVQRVHPYGSLCRNLSRN